MGMVDLKLPKVKNEAKTGIGLTPVEQDQYPYEFRIDVSDDMVKKLGLEEADAEDGVVMEAVGVVTSKNVNQIQGGGKSIRLTIQIQKADIKVKSGSDKMETEEFMKSRKGRK